MRWPRRTPPLPDDQRAPLGLQPRDRVVAAARLRDGSWVAATHDALLLGDVRLAWVDVTHAQWRDEDETLTLQWLTEAGRGERRLLVDEPHGLPDSVYARVTATIVLSRHVPVPGRRGGVRVAARRQPGVDDLTWQVVPDAGLDPADPAVRDAVNEALRQMTLELGD